VDELWVSDASPLIVLAKAGHAPLLEAPGRQLLIPEAVVSEVLAGPAADPGRRLLESGFGRRVVAAEIPARLLEWGLGRGETEVLAVAMENATGTAVLDDLAARRCAAALGVPVIGTLGVVVRAKRVGAIETASVVVEALRRAEFRIDDQAVRAALASVGETWTGGG
jgi:predicted nucleic acid-binding protein